MGCLKTKNLYSNEESNSKIEENDKILDHNNFPSKKNISIQLNERFKSHAESGYYNRLMENHSKAKNDMNHYNEDNLNSKSFNDLRAHSHYQKKIQLLEQTIKE